MQTDARRMAAAAGAVSAVGTPTLIVLATLLAPWFSWAGNALSDLGVAPETALLFNGALIGGGLVSLPFAWLLFHRQGGLGGAARSVLFALTGLTLAGIGAFPSDTALHFPVAVSFFLLLTATLTVDGLLRRSEQSGRLALLAASTHVVGWIAWGQGLRPGPGLALPEFVGALALSTWIVALAPAAPLDEFG
ncbi:MAG: DUF998 domain-containing protein [Halobaculum sp.]